ncbi:MAG: CBS domain-containing protein, partial [Marinobacter sp.]|nr:CBS domain-containing protein [Marinobacter sp.]
MNASKLHFDPCIAEIIPPGRGVLICAPQTPLHEVAERMRDAAVSSIMVTEDGCPVGIWTEHDALGIDLGSPGVHDRPVAEVMSSPVQGIAADAHLTDAAHRFRDQHIRHLLVTDPVSEAPLGIISLTDVVLNQGIEHYLHFRTVGTLVGHDSVRADESEPLSRVAARMREARV